MPETPENSQEHVVTLRFSGPLAQEMADHFFEHWLEGGLDEIWEEALDDADIADGIRYEADSEKRSFLIEAIADDDEDEDESDDEDDSNMHSRAVRPHDGSAKPEKDSDDDSAMHKRATQPFDDKADGSSDNA